MIRVVGCMWIDNTTSFFGYYSKQNLTWKKRGDASICKTRVIRKLPQSPIPNLLWLEKKWEIREKRHWIMYREEKKKIVGRRVLRRLAMEGRGFRWGRVERWQKYLVIFVFWELLHWSIRRQVTRMGNHFVYATLISGSSPKITTWFEDNKIMIWCRSFSVFWTTGQKNGLKKMKTLGTICATPEYRAIICFKKKKKKEQVMYFYIVHFSRGIISSSKIWLRANSFAIRDSSFALAQIRWFN